MPKQGPAWQRWLARHPVEYEVPAGVTTDLLAPIEAADAPWVGRVASRLSNVMDATTADDIPLVVAWEWAGCSPPYLGERDPHFYNQDAGTERRVRETSEILVSAASVESTEIRVSARRDYYVPTPSWWSALEVPYGCFREGAPRRGLLRHGSSLGSVHPGGGHPRYPCGCFRRRGCGVPPSGLRGTCST